MLAAGNPYVDRRSGRIYVADLHVDKIEKKYPRASLHNSAFDPASPNSRVGAGIPQIVR